MAKEETANWVDTEAYAKLLELKKKLEEKIK